MITLAATAVVLATGAFLVLKQPKADVENAPQTPNSALEPERSGDRQPTVAQRASAASQSQATPTAKQSGPLSPLSGPANDAKTPAQGIPSGASQVRTTLPAAPPAKPILVAQANTTPKALQLGQSAPADPVPARKPDPAKWVKVNQLKDFQDSQRTELHPDKVVFKENEGLNPRIEGSNLAMRARIILPTASSRAMLEIRKTDAGEYRADITDSSITLALQNMNGGTLWTTLKRVDIPPTSFNNKGSEVTLSAQGSRLTLWLNDDELCSIEDSKFAKGRIIFAGNNQAIMKDMAWQSLDATVAQTPIAPAVSTPPAAPSAAPLPPELTTLQQQYDKLLLERVTGIYDADVAKLNAGYLAGLDRAAATAQSAGELDTVLAIQKEKELIIAKQPVPATDDAKTPEALKNLRTIFRTSLAKLDEQRTSNHTALLTPYATRLKQIEADLTKAGRIPDAVAVKTYREGLGTNPVPVATIPAPTAPPTPTMPVTSDDPKLPKADERQAAEWVLGIGGNIFIKEGTKSSFRLTSKAGLPKGRFEILDFKLDGKTATGPVNAESLKVLAGLKDLTSFWIDNIELADEELSFIGTFPNLIKLEISHDNKFTGSAVKHLAKLRSLTEFTTFSTAFNDDAVALLADCKGLTRVMLGGNSNITDACIPHLNKLPKLQALSVSATKVTPEGLAQLETKLATLGMNLVSGESIQPVVAAVAPKQPQLSRVVLSYKCPDDTLTLLKAFPKLTVIDMAGSANEGLLDGLGDLPGLAEFIAEVPFKLTDAGLMKFVPLKKLKKLTIRSTTVTDTGIAAFQKARPDVTVTR